MTEKVVDDGHLHLWRKEVEDVKRHLEQKGLDPSIIEEVRYWGMLESDEEHFAFSVDKESCTGKSMVAIVSYHYENSELHIRNFSEDENNPHDSIVSVRGVERITIVETDVFPGTPTLKAIRFEVDLSDLGKLAVLVNKFGGSMVEMLS